MGRKERGVVVVVVLYIFFFEKREREREIERKKEREREKLIVFVEIDKVGLLRLDFCLCEFELSGRDRTREKGRRGNGVEDGDMPVQRPQDLPGTWNEVHQR